MAILAVAGTVGQALNGVKSLFESIGIRIKGATKHLTYDQAMQVANSFGGSMIKVFHDNYSVTQLLSVMPTIKNRWIAAMSTQWGRTGINASIATDLEAFELRVDGIEHMAQSFALWCAINSDAARPDDFNTVFAHYWKWLFVDSFASVGLNTNAIALEGSKAIAAYGSQAGNAGDTSSGGSGATFQVTVPVNTGQPSVNLPNANVSLAGIEAKYIVAVIAVAIVLSIIFKKKGG